MSSCPFSALARLLTFDFTGRGSTRRMQHPYFGELTYFGSKRSADCYWEAELSAAGLDEPVRVTMSGSSEGPAAEEQAFCQAVLGDLDALFERCRAAFASEFERWTERPLPCEWRAEFALLAFKVPVGGDESSPWEISYFVNAIERCFVARFRDGRLAEVVVDG